MRQLPIGIQDFKELRKEGFYYVDKSVLIGKILEQNRRGVFLYTRPRRFGKSLNLSMIDAFFNLKYEGNNWFDGLEISDHPEFDAYRNAFPVINVDLRFSDIQDFGKFMDDYNSKLFDVFARFEYLRNSPELGESHRALFARLFDGTKTVTDSAQALSKLCSMLEMHHGKKVVVLIDEYDNAVNNVPDPELRRRILSFMRDVLSSLLKGNDSLQFSALTGIMQIAKENIFSGLNNLYVNNVLSERFDEMFGFTDGEVRRICADYGRPDMFDKAREWYDGYRFGNADIYNPWSILNYVQRGFSPRPYWVNTSGNGIIGDLLSHTDGDVIDRLKMLGSGEGINADVKTTVTFDELSSDPELVYSMMVVSGYLKAVPDDGGYILSVPNKELYSVFAEMVTRYAYGSDAPSVNLRRFCSSLLANDVAKMERALYGLVADTVSSRVLNDEHSYQAFITGLLMSLSGRYAVTADFESGKGFYDIRMARKAGPGCNVVMELKRSDSESSLQADAERALCQVREKDYAHGLEGKTVLYGVSFFGKVPRIVSEMI